MLPTCVGVTHEEYNSYSSGLESTVLGRSQTSSYSSNSSQSTVLWWESRSVGANLGQFPHPIQLQEYQTDMGRCRFDKPRSVLPPPHIAETSALVTKTLV